MGGGKYDVSTLLAMLTASLNANEPVVCQPDEKDTDTY
jgi:hypothetical protein